MLLVLPQSLSRFLLNVLPRQSTLSLLFFTHRARASALSAASIFAAMVALAFLSASTRFIDVSATGPGRAQPFYLAAVRSPVRISLQSLVGNTITVNSTADLVDGADGLCTLREAITAANTDTASGLAMGECVAGSGDDIITFTTSGTITLLTALPDISTSISINGPGANLLIVQRSTATGTPNFRIFNVSSGITAAISGLTISGGRSNLSGAGVSNGGTLTLARVTITNNTAELGVGHGGGVSNTGNLTLTHSTVSGNTGGVGGGGISNSNLLTIMNSTIVGNLGGSTGPGGGLYNSGGIATVTNSTFSANTTNTNGGGVYNAGGTVILTNTTVTNNAATNGTCGGVVGSGGTRIKNTIIANNLSSDVFGTIESQDYNLIENTAGTTFTGTTTHNITGVDPLIGPLANNGGPTLVHALLPGSPAIDAGSNANLPPDTLDLDGDSNTTEPLPFDQRGTGFNRTADGNGEGTATVDIGAFEVQTILVTNTNDSGAGSLRQAIIDANVNSDSSAINFQNGLTGTISLLTALPDLSTSVAINGPGASVLTVQRSTAGGTPNFRIFKVNSGITVTIAGLTISNGNLITFGDNGGGVLNSGALTLTNCNIHGNNAGTVIGAFGLGGGIYHAGSSLKLNNCNIGGLEPSQANTVGASGAGVFSSGPFTMNAGSIVGNSGVGLAVGTGTTATLNEVIITNNTEHGNGGAGVLVLGTAKIANSVIANNTASGGSGGGIRNAGTLTLVNSTVSGNSSIGSGGGVYNFNATGTLINVTVTNNRADTDGNSSGSENSGGVLQGGGTLLLHNTIVAGNFRDANASITADDIVSPISPSSSFNLIGSCIGCGLSNGVNNNQVGVVNPRLDALANNGGPTMTHLLLPGSPAINAGSNALLPPDTFDLDGDADTGEPLPIDQRGPGFNRIVNTTVDIGAVETSYSISATAGGGQSAQIRSAFPTQLQATVKESNIVRNGISVSFTAPTSGSSGTFTGGSTTAAATTNASGIATAPVFTANGTAGGPYIVIASLGAGLPTAAFSLTNLKAVTNTAVSSSVNPTAEGQSVTFTATVTSTAGTPTGTIQFKANGINLGAPVALDLSGVATFATSGLSLGTHVITADYNGDANFLTSTGSLAGGQLVGGIVQFSGALSGVDESDLRVNLTVARSGSTTAAASVKFATIDAAGLQNCNVFNGVASPRCDFIVQSGTVAFAAGETSKTFSVAIINDSYAEGTENFTVTISNPSGATLGAQSNTTVMIVDNESVTGPNPIDQTPFFVRQQYLDFLGREPDPPGEAAWISTINNCPPNDTTCDRIHVSSIFFQSAEFQQRGNFVYRFYPVSYGRKPDYSEFVPDLASVSGFLSDAQLEAAKLAFIAEFMSRPAFVSAYNGLNNTQYVDTLLTTAGVTLATRQAMIDGLNAGTLTRAQVLRHIAESAEVGTKYFTQAYAVMEYFGYLRRQPDAFYLDWIAVLDGGGSPRTMAIGFVNSTEYRQRFGP